MDNYYIGLDLGSNSVGWAVTDQDYNLKRLKGKHAWGARIFSTDDENDTGSKQRRIFRSNRRRMQRRKYRIQLLNEIFAKELNKVDNTFLLRLDNSTFLFEDKDKNIKSKNLIFKKRKDEVEFYKKYPTIWHLRLKLMENDSDALSDVRNVYLAMHHIYKYRGNFLIEGNYDSKKFDDKILCDLNEYFKQKLETEEILFDGDVISSSKSNDLLDILFDDELNKVNKKKSLKSLFTSEVPFLKEYIEMFNTLIVGGKYSLKKINPDSDLTIDFTSASFEDNANEIANELENDFIIVQKAKQIYDYYCLRKLLGDSNSLSEAMVNIYEQHKNDLKLLKKVIKDIDQNLNQENKLYNLIFKDENNVLGYEALTRGLKGKRCSLIDFNKEITRILNDNKNSISSKYADDVKYILSKTEKYEFLKIIAHASDSKIPHQLHQMELEKIIDNCKELYPFLEKDKMLSLFTFRVPYYCGPLDDRSEFSNVQRNSNEKITPWNFDKVINLNQSKKNFMNNLTGTCSYLYGEKVMPKVSLLYEEYMIRNVVNTMLVNGSSLEGEEKEMVVNYLLSRSKTTLKQLIKHLSIQMTIKESDILISNIDECIIFQAPASAHIRKSNLFNLDKDYDLIENLIYLATIYADDKKSLKEYLNEDYKFLSREQIKCILNLPTNKWARFSKKLLKGIFYIDDNGLAYSIMDLLRVTNKNFQMIINDKQYGFDQIIKNENDEIVGTKTKNELIDEILDSTPANAKRTIHQTLLVIDDIIKISKNKPQKIFVEVTREDDMKKKGIRTASRDEELNYFFNSLKKDKDIVNKEHILKLQDELNTIEEGKIKSRHVYLYFKQMGYDMYTGEKINLEDVLNSNKYDLDHIIPQSLIKDDSLDNLVLVDRNYNQKIKKDLFPIPQEIKNDKVVSIWRYLKKINMISDKKFNNLMRTSEISYEEISNFVNAQINIVNSSNIVLRNILEVKYPEVKVVFSKAQYPSYLRKELRVYKNRDLNDTHHAVDAYLNIVSGNVLSTTFSNLYMLYKDKMEHDGNKTFNMERTLDVFLNKDDKKFYDRIRRNCLRRDILVTFKLDYNDGAFYKTTINPKAENSALYATHTNSSNPMNDVTKYGGYTSLSQSYIMALSYENNGKIIKKLERVPVLIDRVYGRNIDVLLKKIVNDENAKNIKLIKKINLNQKIKYQGCEYLLYTSNEKCNKYKMAQQNYIDNNDLEYLNFAIKKVEYLDNNLDTQMFILNRKDNKIEITKRKNLYICNKLLEKIKLNIYDSCNYIAKCRNLNLNEFEQLSLKEQIETLNNLIKLLSRNCESIVFNKKLSNMNMAFNLRISNNYTNQDITLIHESPTGLIRVEEKI